MTKAMMTATRRRNLLAIPLLGLLGGFTVAASASSLTGPEHELFDRYELVADTAPRQTVVTGFFFDGPTAEIAMLHIDETGARRLHMFGLEGGGWVSVLEATLGPDVVFVDVANIGGRERLITYARGHLSWFDPVSATERALVQIDASYDSSPGGTRYGSAETTQPYDEGEIPRVDIARDVNQDGLDDFIVPGVGGFGLFLQIDGGTFADRLELGPAEPFRNETAFDDTRTYGEVGVNLLTLPWYLSRVHQLDYDLDGRSDLAFWNEDHFDVYLQTESGTFSASAETFDAEVPFDSDGAYSLLFAFSGRNAFSLISGFGKRTDRTVLREFRDMNGDGIADLLTMTVEGRSVLRLRTGYNVHYGARTSDGISFARDASTAIRTQVKAPPGYASQWLEDFDGDGRIDVLSGGVRTGLGSMIRAMLNTSITLSAELFCLDDGGYPDTPTATRKVRSDIDIRGGRDGGFWPPALVGDVNGDGSSDLLVGKNREELHLFLGGPGFLDRQPVVLAVDLPGVERNSWLVDIDRDGKQDLLMHHASASEPHRVAVLITR